MSQELEIEEIERKLKLLEDEKRQLRDQLEKLQTNRQSNEGGSEQKAPVSLGRPTSLKTPTIASEKVELFLKLFRGRGDIYARRWENSKTNKQGYSPVCENEWVKPICQKPKIKCADCSHQKFRQLCCCGGRSKYSKRNLK